MMDSYRLQPGEQKRKGVIQLSQVTESDDRPTSSTTVLQLSLASRPKIDFLPRTLTSPQRRHLLQSQWLCTPRRAISPWYGQRSFHPELDLLIVESSQRRPGRLMAWKTRRDPASGTLETPHSKLAIL